MEAQAGPVFVAALVVVVAGARKLHEPSAIAGRLASWSVPAPRPLGRALGVVELAIGGVVLGVGGPIPAALLGALYVAFTVALVLGGRDVPCGCFGTSDAPPGAAHLLVNGLAAVSAAVAVAAPVDPVWSELAGSPVAGVPAGLLLVTATGLVVAALELLPMALHEARRNEPSVRPFAATGVR